MNVIVESFFAFITVVVLTLGIAAHPHTARCPRGWWLPEGIRRSGDFTCRPDIVGGDDDVLTGRQTSTQPPGYLRGHIYCTNGTMPIIIEDGTVVGCQRGGWQW